MSIDRKLFEAVERLGAAIDAALRRFAVDHGLSLLQAQLLETLGEGTPRRIGDLAAELAVSLPTVSDAVGSLQAKGLARRVPDPDDRRGVLVVLSEEGERLAALARKTLGPMLTAAAEVPEKDREIALGVLLRTIAALYRMGFITLDRSCFTCRHYDPGGPRCLLLQMPLRPADLRVRCPEHTPAAAGD